MRTSNEAAQRAHAFHLAYPTASDPGREAADAMAVITRKEKEKEKIKFENFLPPTPPEFDQEMDLEDQIFLFTEEGYLNPSAAYTADLAELCNFDASTHVPSMHFQARVRAAIPTNRGNAKKRSEWHSVYCLKDSGATLVVINARLVKDKKLAISQAPQPLKVKLADHSTRTLSQTVEVEVQFDLNYKYKTTAFVMDLGPTCDMLLGTPWLRSLGPHLADWEKGTLAFRHNNRIITLKSKRRKSFQNITVNGVELISAAEARHECRAWEKRKDRREDVRPGFVFLQPLDISCSDSEEDTISVNSEEQEPTAASRHTPENPDPNPEDGDSAPRNLIRKALSSEEADSIAEPIDESETAAIHMVSPHDRDDQYPFGDTEEYPISAKRSKPRSLPDEDMHRSQTDTLLNTYLAIAARAPLNETDQQQLTNCRNRLFASLKQIHAKGATLGDEFWTDGRLSILADVFKTFYDTTVFSEDIPGAHQGSDRLPMAQIRMRDDWDGRAPFARPIKLSDAHMEIMRSQLSELLEKGIIEPSASPFGAAAFVVPKPHTNNKKWRMVVSYKALNELVVSDRWPLPDIPTILGRMTGKSIMSTFDVTSAFYMNKVTPAHVERTAMTTPFGSFAWLYLPMGLSVAPAIQQRNINLCLHGPIKPEYIPSPEDPWRAEHPCFPDLSLPTEQSTAVFIDDGLCFSDSVEEHAIQHLPVALERLKIYGMKVKPSKANLFCRSTDFLGYRITTDGLAPQSTKVDAVVKFPLPKTLTQLKAFLGLVSFYRVFIYNFSQKARPLNELTKLGVQFPKPGQWSDEQLEAFAILKLALVRAPVLTHFDWTGAMDGSRRVRVQSDASLFAMGAVLMQEAVDKDGVARFHPVAFASKSFIPAECNYSATERELRALVWATTEVFRHYLVGLPAYQLQGDHQPLKALLSAKEYSRRQYRWLERLAEYNVPVMEYVPGKQLIVPDALSRRADLEELLQPVRASMSAEQRARWGMVNPEATFGDVKAGPLPEVVTGPKADHPLVVRPATLSTIPPVDSRPIEAFTNGQNALQSSSMGEQSAESAGTSKSTAGNEHAIADTLNLIVGSGFRFLSDWTSDEECDSRTQVMAGERHASMEEPYATSHQLLHQLQYRIGEFALDASPFSTGFKGLKWLKNGHRVRKLWEGKNVLVDCTKGEKFPGQARKLLDTFLAAQQENSHSSALFIMPYSTESAGSWEDVVCSSTAFRRLHCFRTGNTTDFLKVDKRGRNIPGPYTTTCPTQLWWAEAEQPAAHSVKVTTRSAGKTTKREEAQPAEASPPLHPAPEQTIVNMKSFLQAVREGYRKDNNLSKILQENAPEKEAQGPSHSNTFKATDCEMISFGGLIWRPLADKVQLVLPEDREVINFAVLHSHDSATAGHLGFRKTLLKAQRRFYWPRMQQDIKDYVRSCHICQLMKYGKKPIGRLHSILPPHTKWASIYLDFVNGLPLTENGYDAILTVTEAATRMVHFIPLRFADSKAPTIAQLLKDGVFRLHGMPRKITSDRDPRFSAEFWKELHQALGVHIALTTPFHPQGNGQAENTNRSMETILRSFCNSRQRNWDSCLSTAEFAINDSVHASTGYSPFFLNYGFNPRSEIDLTLQAALEQGPKTTAKDVAQSWLEEFKRMDECLRQARENIIKAQESQGYYANKGRRDLVFKVGDSVMVSAKHITRPADRGTQFKLRRQWIGPFQVLEVKYADDGEPCAYRINMPDDWGPYSHVISQDKLKPYQTAQAYWPLRKEAPPPEPEIVQGSTEYVVEAVEARRKNRGRWEWLVKWQGYSSDHNRWLTFDRLNTGGVNEAWRRYEQQRLGPRYVEPSDEEVGLRLLLPSNQSISGLEQLAQPIRIHEHLHRITHVRAPSGLVEKRVHYNSPYRFLVLYCGTGSVEATMKTLFPNAEIISLDIDPRSAATAVCDVREWVIHPEGMKQYAPGYFHAIWASPPCTQYSIAKAAPFTQDNPHSPRDYQTADSMVLAVLDAIRYLQPHFWYIENPRGGLWKRPFMTLWNEYRLLTSYCKYGTPYRKHTDIWTNVVTSTGKPLLLPPCSLQHPCDHYGKHPETAQAGPSSNGRPGQGDTKKVYPIPKALLQALLKPLKHSSWNSPL